MAERILFNFLMKQALCWVTVSKFSLSSFINLCRHGKKFEYGDTADHNNAHRKHSNQNQGLRDIISNTCLNKYDVSMQFMHIFLLKFD